jgi:oligo-1,6-glucosidase
MEFWLERGVDGFRVDTVNMYSKGDMADAPITDGGSEWQCE